MSERCEKCGAVTEYNGWPNYETWCVSLWLNNDEISYNQLRGILQKEPDDYKAGVIIKEWIEEENPLNENNSLYGDMLTASLSEVRWREIARANRDES